MKTKIKIIAMLMAMIIGTLAANAQSARRGDTQKRTTTDKSYNKPTNKSVSTARKAPAAKQTATARKGPASRQTTTAKKAPAKRQTSPARNVQRTQPQRGTSSYNKKPASSNRGTIAHTSTTTRHNPKSKYRKPDKTVHVGNTYVNPKPADRQYTNNNTNKGKAYKGNKTIHHNANMNYKKGYNKHYYYPANRVKIHVHPMTYRGNYRALYYPRYSDIVWSRSMRRHYNALYPSYSGWHYSYGYRIQTVSVFDARYNVNEIARVYGRVYATWYNKETDDMLLFFGGEYPNQVFTMILPGNVARRYSWRPERYFLGQHISATGLITQFDGRAEMVVKRRTQIDVY